MPLHQSADLPYTITFAHRQAFFATANRPLPTVVFLSAARLPLHQSADLPYTITFAHRQAFFATVNRPLPTVVFLVGGKIVVAASADLPYTITFAHRQAFFATANRTLPTVVFLVGGKVSRHCGNQPFIGVVQLLIPHQKALFFRRKASFRPSFRRYPHQIL